jgi:hypothetical protein
LIWSDWQGLVQLIDESINASSPQALSSIGDGREGVRASASQKLGFVLGSFLRGHFGSMGFVSNWKLEICNQKWLKKAWLRFFIFGF